MNVFAEYFEENGIEYRGTTLLQFGESFNLIGSAILMNPGKAEKTTLVSTDIFLAISNFFNSNLLEREHWFNFNDDQTMKYLVKIFNGYYATDKEEPMIGVIQLFNLHNIKDENIRIARQKSIYNTSIYLHQDAKEIIPLLKDKPVYLGWSNEYESTLRAKNNALEIFSYVSSNCSNYLNNIFSENKFYHPRRINSYYIKDEKIRQTLIKFYTSLHK